MALSLGRNGANVAVASRRDDAMDWMSRFMVLGLVLMVVLSVGVVYLIAGSNVAESAWGRIGDGFLLLGLPSLQ